MNALQPAAAPAVATPAPGSAQPAVAVAVAVALPVATPTEAQQASATPFVRWLTDVGSVSTPHDGLPSPVVDVTEPMPDDDMAADVAWPAGGAPDGLVRLGSSLSAAVPVSPLTSAPAEIATGGTDEADAAREPAQATPLPVVLPVAVPLVMPAIAMPAPAVVPMATAQTVAAVAPAAVALPTTPVVVRAATLAIAPSLRAPAPMAADDEAVDDPPTTDEPPSSGTSAALPVARASGRAIADANLLATAPSKATPTASAGTAAHGPVDTVTAAPRGPSLAALLAVPATASTHDGLDVLDTHLAASTPLVASPVPPSDSSAALNVKLPATPPTAWQTPLLDALGDHVRLQLAQRSEQAVIRLDPPSLGTVEIVLRHEAGVLQVQLSASHTEVQRQLLHIADSLRQDLSQRQYSDVSVQVAMSSSQADAEGRQRQAQRQQSERDARPGRALAGDDADRRFTLSTTAE